jgi:sphingomyelin phosphodiesterase
VLIERFEHVVKGQFYGHTHNDHLETVVSRVDGRPIATAFIAPSGTTYTYQNPSFRVFEMNGDDNSVNDYVQYRLNLDKANSEGPSAILDWAAVYRFKELYGLKSASNPVDVLEITGKLKQNKDVIYIIYCSY